MFKAIWSYLKRYRWFRKFRSVISLDGSPYLYRYRLWSSKRFGIYVHNIVRSDASRHLHDHPFWFWSLILWSGYWEHTPEGRKTWWPGMLVRHAADDLHRVELRRPAWTLVLRGPKYRDWGFQTENGWVFYKNYEALGEMDGQVRS